ncbi:GMC family oxidoreductase [Burkholderia cenocepacia]|uniref:GMC family oxidoreductase n=1 Tax=Burkholderia cenocepacia TaxID=95486 RepID=UPI001BA0BBB7|nr:GMC family oxidoreductase [Burkholderia cenocepacia]MBR8392484.1 GMC family oxidoreductase [Burkholderia cenocepacia]
MKGKSEEVYDVVIVGAGPSGAVAAKRFSEAGLSVICLEQGGYPDYTLIKNDKLDFEFTKDRFYSWNPNHRRGPADYPVNDSESEVAPLMWNGVGGSSMLYAAAWHRLKPSDFRVRSLDGVGDDWPLTYEDLAPFYDRVSADFSVSGVAGDPAFPHHEIPLPPFGLGEMEKKMIRAHDRLGWHWWPGTNAIASVKHNNLEPCVRRGACLWGCFDGAKASVDRTHWPINLKLGVKLVQFARVLRVETDSAGLATGVTYIDRTSGSTQFQPGRIVVIAANGIGTPRLLLNSSTPNHPNGLANSSGMVGKRLMMHPFATVIGLFDDFFENWQGPFGQRLYSMEFAETRKDTDFVRGAKWQLMGTGGPLNTIGAFPWGDDGGWGSEFHKTVSRRFGRSIDWSIIAEDLPEEHNMVVLDPNLADSDGMPAPKMIYRNSENTQRLMKYNVEMASRALKEAGAYDVLEAPFVRETGWHMLGTCVMGNDPRTSVVDSYGRAHDVANLFVFDGSVMPTTSCVNPTGTVAALALRNAEAALKDARLQRSSTANA